MIIRERFLAKYFLKKTFKERKKLKEYFPVQFNFHPTSCPSINELSLFLYNLELINYCSLFVFLIGLIIVLVKIIKNFLFYSR